MAIRNRRGVYSDFDKTKMVDGEFAVVKSGDPDGSGKAVYISFQSGTADRLALFDDLEEYGGKIDAITVNGGEELPIDDRTVDIPIPTVDISAPAGNIVEFSTGGDNMPMKAVEVSMSPIQDLNGYDSPWPAGGGKNLFDISTAIVGRYINENGNAQSTTTTDWSVSDFIPVQASTTYTFTPNSTAGGSAKHGFYDSNKNFISVIASGPQTFTTPSNCAYVRVSFRTASENVQLEKGSTATAWESYANVCPITGRTGASVVVSGKNVLKSVPQDHSQSGVGVIVNDDGTVSLSGTATSTSIAIMNFEHETTISGEQNIGKKCLPNGTYKLSVGNSNNAFRLQVLGSNNASGTSGLVALFDANNGEITIDDTYAYNWVRLYVANGTNCSGITLYPMIRQASIEDDTYEPYKGATTYPIVFTSAGTVYAGTVDLVSGVLTVTHSMINAKDVTWRKSGTNPFVYTQLASTADTSTRSEIWCNIAEYKNVQSAGSNDNIVYWGGVVASDTNNGNLCIMASTVTPVLTDWNTYIANNDVQILYKLATPLTYNLTPVQVMSLLGENVVWSEDGTISNLKYSADISLVVADLYSMLSS